MVTEELTRLMQVDAARHGGALDLEQIRGSAGDVAGRTGRQPGRLW